MKRRKAILKHNKVIKHINDVSTLFRTIEAVTAKRAVIMTEKQAYLETRNLCIYVFRKNGMTVTLLSKIFNVSRAAILNAINKVDGFIEVDKKYREDYRGILGLLK